MIPEIDAWTIDSKVLSASDISQFKLSLEVRHEAILIVRSQNGIC